MKGSTHISITSVGLKRRLPMVAVLGGVLALLAACATAPPMRPITDYKSIAGNWHGYGGTTQMGTGPVQLTIREDGSGEFFLPRPGTRAPVSFNVNDGKLLYETAASTGTATLHEDGGRSILKGEGSRKDRTGTSWFELKRRQ